MRNTLIIVAVGMLGACSSVCAVEPLEPGEVLTRDAERQIYAPILLSRSDDMTEDSMKQVIAHNNVYWCRHPDVRPETFDESICQLPD